MDPVVHDEVIPLTFGGDTVAYRFVRKVGD